MINVKTGAERLTAAFIRAREQGSHAVIPYITAGDPSLEETVAITHALVAGGADVVEWGVPFSDPLADGVTIQRSSQRSLAGGTTSRRVLEAVRTLRGQGCDVPLALLVYGNILWRYGVEAFLQDAAEAGVDGLIVPDIPTEEGASFAAAARKIGIAWIPLVAPTSPSRRIAQITAAGTGFVYCVSVTGVTGARSELPPGLADFLQRVRGETSLPLAVGFGVSRPDQARAIVHDAGADGVIVGSALVRALEEAPSAQARQQEATRFIREIKSAV